MYRRNRVKDSVKPGRSTQVDQQSPSDRKSRSSNASVSVLVTTCFVLLLFLASGYPRNESKPISPTHIVQKVTAANDLINTPRSTNEVLKAASIDTVDRPPLLDTDGSRLHIIFSTDCSQFQHWQSYLLFYSALKVKQPGHVTRIASGCSDDEKLMVQRWHDEHIRNVISDRFSVHFTPRFSSVKTEMGEDTSKEYKFFNKPFGLRHWMEYGDGMGIDKSTGEPLDTDVIVILIDPDMILLRPIRADYTDESQTITQEKDIVAYPRRVQHGHPIAQKYGLGTQWQRFGLSTITGTDSSPAMSVSQSDGAKHYPAGPPYIATALDMYRIAIKWTEFAPKVHAEYPYLLAEMFAYCIAAAHLNLPHLMVESLMVSNTDAGGEAWPFVDAIEGSVCELSMNLDTKEYAPLPNVIHFCQRYMVGDSFFAKRQMPKLPGRGFFECDSPLLDIPPLDLGEAYLYKGRQKESLTPKQAKRNAFMICTLTKLLNDAGAFFKKNHCSEANWNMDLKLSGG